MTTLDHGRISYTVQEAAAATGLSVDTIRRAFRTGEFPVHHRGTRVLILRSDLEQWIAGMPTERSA